MKKLVVGVVVDTKDAEGSIERLKDHLNDLNTTGKGTQKEIFALENAIDKLTDSQKKAADATAKASAANEASKKGLKGIAQGIGNVIKSLGIIGIALKVFEILSDALKKNKKFADALSTATNSFNIVLNDIVSLGEPLIEMLKSAFEDPKQAVIDLANSIKTNLINRVVGLIELLPELGKAASLALSGKWGEAGEVATNAILKITTGVEGLATKTIAYTGSVIKQGEAITQLDNAMASLAQRIEQLRLLSQKAAEEQRQIRDDESKSIEERLDANDKLAAILIKQANGEKAILQTALARANAEVSAGDSTVEAAAAVLDAKNALLEVDERIVSALSEQKTNNISLRKEALDTINAQIDGETELLNLKTNVGSEVIANEIDSINRKLQAAEVANLIEGQSYKDLLKAKLVANAQYQIAVDKEKADSDAKERADAKTKLDAEFQRREDEISLMPEGTEKEIKALNLAFDMKREAFIEKYGEESEMLKGLEEQRTAELVDINKKAEEEKRQATLDTVAQGLQAAQGFAGAAQGLSDLIFDTQIANAEGNDELQEKLRKKQFKANKAIGIVNAVISTALAVVGQLSTPGPVGWAGAALAAITGAVQIATIASAKYSPTGGSAPPPTPEVPSPPSTSGTSQGPNVSFTGSGNNLNNIGGGSNTAPTPIINANVTISETEITGTQNTVSEYENNSLLSGG